MIVLIKNPWAPGVIPARVEACSGKAVLVRALGKSVQAERDSFLREETYQRAWEHGQKAVEL